MKPTTWLCLLFACCSAAAAWTFKAASKTTGDASSKAKPITKSQQFRHRLPSGTDPNQPHRNHQRPDAAGQSLLASAATAVPVPHRKVLATPTNRASVSESALVSEAEWQKHAELAEGQANRELRRLATLLDLDPVQQDLVFPTLVRQSSSWLPGMTAETISGGAVDAASADISDFLNSDQQQTLADAELDRQEWWQEILPRLLPPDAADSETGASSEIPADPTETNTPPSSKEFDGSEILLEE